MKQNDREAMHLRLESHGFLPRDWRAIEREIDKAMRKGANRVARRLAINDDPNLCIRCGNCGALIPRKYFRFCSVEGSGE